MAKSTIWAFGQKEGLLSMEAVYFCLNGLRLLWELVLRGDTSELLEANFVAKLEKWRGISYDNSAFRATVVVRLRFDE